MAGERTTVQMTRDQWIVIPNWDGFQHYKDRTPKWIKNYTELLADDHYLDLTGDQRAILHGLWLEYASARCQLRLDTRSITRRLNLRVTMKQLEALNHAGFIHFSASKPLAKPVPRLEVEEKRSSSTLNKTRNEGPTVTHIQKLIHNRVITDQVDLEAELRAHNLNGTIAETLKAQLPAA